MRWPSTKITEPTQLAAGENRWPFDKVRPLVPRSVLAESYLTRRIFSMLRRIATLPLPVR